MNTKHLVIRTQLILGLGLGLSVAACDDASGGYGDDGNSGGSYYGSGNTGGTANQTGSTTSSGGSAATSTNGGVTETSDGSGATAGTSGGSASPDIQWSDAGYLVDGAGQPLYFFVNDVAGTQTSACAGDCAANWPVFDAKEPSLGANLTATDFGRFTREDGAWQSSYKGRPLYHFANDAGGGQPAGEGVGGRWYLARDYFVFFGSDGTVTPRNEADAGTPFLTNSGGRTLYIFENDTPAANGAEAESACADACLAAWPAWAGPDDLGGLTFPGAMTAGDFDRFQRADGGFQLTYHGWPLYYFASDEAAGEVEGHSRDNWTAVSPASFEALASNVGSYRY